MTDRRHQQRFEMLLREHRKIIFKVASVYTREVEDRNDLAQEISVQLWRSFGSYDARRAKFSTWMYRIALNVAISQRRREKGSLAHRTESLHEHQLEALGGGEPIAEQDERLAALHIFIGEFDALNRALILLYLEDKSYAEIAEILGISETNVATKLGRIKQRLRGQMTATETIAARA